MKKLWGIRHIRWLYLSIRFAFWWEQMGQYFLAPNERDIQFLDNVWKGKA